MLDLYYVGVNEKLSFSRLKFDTYTKLNGSDNVSEFLLLQLISSTPYKAKVVSLVYCLILLVDDSFPCTHLCSKSFHQT